VVSAIESVTIGVSSLAEALGLFRDVMLLQVDAEFDASSSVLAAWGVDAAVRARVVELSCQAHPVGRLRLVEYSPPARQHVRVHHGPGPQDSPLDIGPKAIDFYIPPPARTAWELVTAAGFVARSGPIRHELGATVSEEFVFWGPDGVPLLMMVGHRHGPDQMRPLDAPFSEVATVSVVGSQVEATRGFYEDVLGLRAITDTDTAPEFLDRVNELTGTPKGTGIHWLLYAEPGQPSGKILVVVFGGAPGKRLEGRMRPGHLGFSLLTHFAPDLDVLEARLRRAGFAVPTPPTSVEWRGGTRRIMLAGGPNEELFEFVEGEVGR